MAFQKHYFPVGSVVGLGQDARRFLIIGRQMYSENSNIVRDYAAVEYPNGFVDAKEKFTLFDQADIEIVYHYGYLDEKEIELDALLHKAASSAEKNKR